MLKKKKSNLLVRELLKQLWNSSTLASWGSLFARSFSFVVVLPLILPKFSAAEIALYYLFITIMGLQMLADMGFSSTFARVIAYAMGGAKEITTYRNASVQITSEKPNYEQIEKIIGTMSWIYGFISLIWLSILVTGGSWSVAKSIEGIGHGVIGWTAWGVVILGSTFRMFGLQYSSFLMGVNEVALLRRWEMVTWMASSVASFLVLFLGGGLLYLVVAIQFFLVVNVFLNRHFCRIIQKYSFNRNYNKQFDPEILKKIWHSVWRSGIGILMSAGLVQGTGIIYARIGPSDGTIASYLLALNIMRFIQQFSQSPFYTKIPILAKLRAEGNLPLQKNIAQKGMRLSFWVLVIGIILIGSSGPIALPLIKSNADFVDKNLWYLMGLGVFLERYGAMHLQLYSTTNHIVWHITNGVTGIIYICVTSIGFQYLGIFAFPVGQIISNLSFFSWYSAKCSYQAFELRFWRFEKTTSLPPVIILLIVTMLYFFYGRYPFLTSF